MDKLTSLHSIIIQGAVAEILECCTSGRKDLGLINVRLIFSQYIKHFLGCVNIYSTVVSKFILVLRLSTALLRHATNDQLGFDTFG